MGLPFGRVPAFTLVGTLDQRFVHYPISSVEPATAVQLQNWIAELTVDTSDGLSASDWNKQVDVDKFLPAFEDWTFDWLDIPSLVRGAPTVWEFPMVDRDPVDRWVDERTCLIGDAAHVMYPVGSNGASQAIVDARVMGACFLDVGVGPDALIAFEAQLLEPMSALVLRNRGHGPIGILEVVDERSGGYFDDIDDVIPRSEIEAFMANYKSAAGFARRVPQHSAADDPTRARVGVQPFGATANLEHIGEVTSCSSSSTGSTDQTAHFFRASTRLAHLEFHAGRSNLVGGPLVDVDGDTCGSLIIFEASDIVDPQPVRWRQTPTSQRDCSRPSRSPSSQPSTGRRPRRADRSTQHVDAVARISSCVAGDVRSRRRGGFMKVSVLGAGRIRGTTVATLVAGHHEAMLWARDEACADEIRTDHRNGKYLPDFELPTSLDATHHLEVAVSDADLLVVGVPSHAFRSTLEAAKPFIHPWTPVVSLTKGLEEGSMMRMTEVIRDVLPGHPAAALSGPNLAKEIMAGQAAASVIATEDLQVAAALQRVFQCGLFRVYTNHDVIGCEMGGALKNVIAIAAGMAQGLATGDNTRSAVISRGLSEVSRLGEAMGGEPATFAGLAGLGDLVATCVSTHSRNRYVGEQLGQGRSIGDILNEMNMVAEGVKTARTVHVLAERHGIEVPICESASRRHRRDRRQRGLRRTAQPATGPRIRAGMTPPDCQRQQKDGNDERRHIRIQQQ